MKKLMIAAAAAAMVGGAYASNECVACGIDGRAVAGTNPAFYDITLKFKTLTPKAVKCGDCEGYCMENANRTINGIVWTCVNCDDNYPLQIALWEKATKTQFTDDLVYGQVGGYTQYYIGTAKYEYAGTYTSATNFSDAAAATVACQVKFDKDPDSTVKVNDYPKAGQTNWYYTARISSQNPSTLTVTTEDGKYTTCDAAREAAIKLGLTKQESWMTTFDFDTATCAEGKKTGATDCVWKTEDADLVWYRYSKKADKVEAFLQFANNGLTFFAAGFGAFDAKVKVAKSVSGNAVGMLDPTLICQDGGEILEFCSDFECGPDCWGYHADVIAADDSNTFASGTWTLKYNKGLEKKQMLSIVPNYYNYSIETACAQ